MNLCRSCNQDFGSVSAFDAHRVGTHAYLWSRDNEDGRRCLDPAEMEERGFVRNQAGRWSTSSLVRAPESSQQSNAAGLPALAGTSQS